MAGVRASSNQSAAMAAGPDSLRSRMTRWHRPSPVAPGDAFPVGPMNASHLVLRRNRWRVRHPFSRQAKSAPRLPLVPFGESAFDGEVEVQSHGVRE